METSVRELVSRQKQYFDSGITKDVRFRIDMLRKLLEAVKGAEERLLAALHRDLNKPKAEAYGTEIGFLLREIRFALKHVGKWAKPTKVKTSPLVFGSKSRIVPEPYGCALLIAPWNYPVQLAFSPLVAAIAAGNTAVLKPSELTPAVSALIADLVRDTFDPRFVAVVEGGPEATAELLEQPFDCIFFTGSTRVGKIVAEAAARKLVPVTLELGGKSPCIVHRDADVRLSARRIAYGKFSNAGQTCVAPDYLLVHRDVKSELLERLRETIESFYGDDPVSNPNYGKIVNRTHFDRLNRYLSEGRAVIGGQTDPERLVVAPTVLEGVPLDGETMRDEIFGPILPVFEYDDVDEAISFVLEKPKPLALYLFAKDESVQERVLSRVSFGGGCVNDTLMHLATPYLPFGGVGESGTGSYHGEFGFRAFSHYKSVLKQTTAFDIPFRYPSSKLGYRFMRRFMK
ncbi:aldehyde dehydrogenase [Paenibacillus flagellatus]|uniref:Aldehyde dehydrogenase n=1 Tax=Paenibacillus flagellatus TaxID=2211139 RepID=A0A2V5KAJ5_9BACL|nr:aldehyde dehydrogenase [Paenibacillus flagellatus]PYI55114.1 aldehyde dehydrogenase family protein [Paenibacillus flagellatus]